MLSVSDVLIRRQDCFKVVVTGHLNPSADGKLTGGFQTGICIRPAEAENGETGIIALFFYADTAEDPVGEKHYGFIMNTLMYYN